ncbi:peptidylprolyl isomerase [Chloroflexota bacterium]
MVKNGDTVKVHYTGKLDDGTVFDCSVEREPLEFTLGEGKMIPGFEKAVDGMEIGETRAVTIAAKEAYGPHRPEMVLEIDRGQLPKEMTPEVGQLLKMRDPNGRTAVVTITGIGEEKVTLDANHPLAGKDLIFEINLVEATPV